MKHWPHFIKFSAPFIFKLITACCALLAFVGKTAAQNTLVTYQGHLLDSGTPYNGIGQFQFALVTSTNLNPQATATASLSGGFVTAYTVVFGGSGYVTPPAVHIIGGGGSNATAIATINGGAVTAITPDNAGKNYSSAPSVIVDAPPTDIHYTTYWSNDGSSVNGSQPSAAVSVTVSNGLFTVVLGDSTLPNMAAIPTSLFNRPNLQLRIWFSDGVQGAVALDPAQSLTPTPYAAFASAANTASNLVTGLTVQQNSNGAPNLIGGSLGNYVSNSVVGATIAGGGAINYLGFSRTNKVIGNFGTIGGGYGNTADQASTISGGKNNIAASYATVGGGEQNFANGLYAVIAGGQENVASNGATVGGGLENYANGENSTVAGGSINTAGGYTATIGGGQNNIASGEISTVAGGQVNTASGEGSTVAGGQGNTASGEVSTVAGGEENTASGESATVSGGYLNDATGNYATIGGGFANQANTNSATVAGGYSNIAYGRQATVGGGYSNLATNDYSTVAGGYDNTAYDGATVGGGIGNTASGYKATISGGGGGTATADYTTVVGGDANHATAIYATVAGGHGNTASAIVSFAAGYTAQAVHQGAFVWADYNLGAFSSTAANQFSVRATGGARFVTSTGGAGVQIGAGGAAWSSISDRNAKKNFAPLNHQLILEKLAQMPVEKWNYKWESDSDVPNIGPVAQDFKAAFYPGRDDKSISTLEFDGVELAAIQGLNEKVDDRAQKAEGRLKQLETENAELKHRLEAIEKILGQ